MEKVCASGLDRPVLNPGVISRLRTQKSYFTPLSLSFLGVVVTLCLALSKIIANDNSPSSVKPMSSCKKIAIGLLANGQRTCQALAVALSGHHLIASMPKQGPLDYGIAAPPPRQPLLQT